MPIVVLASHISGFTVTKRPFLAVPAVGARDNAPLSEDAVPAGRHPDRLARRRRHQREARQKQTAAHLTRVRREAGQGAASRQIRRVLGAHTGENGRVVRSKIAVRGGRG